MESVEDAAADISGDSPSAAGWRLDLSGGGVRAALAGLGAVYYLRTKHRAERITHVVSVSGGSLVNGALLHNGGRVLHKPKETTDSSTQSAPDAELVPDHELVQFVQQRYRQLRFGWRSLAELVALVGSIGCVVLGAFATPPMLEHYWVPIGCVSLVWMTALLVVGRMLAALALYIGAMCIVLADLSASHERQLVNVSMVVLGVAVLVIGAARRLHFHADPKNKGRANFPGVSVRLWVTFAGLGMLAGVMIRFSDRSPLLERGGAVLLFAVMLAVTIAPKITFNESPFIGVVLTFGVLGAVFGVARRAYLEGSTLRAWATGSLVVLLLGSIVMVLLANTRIASRTELKATAKSGRRSNAWWQAGLAASASVSFAGAATIVVMSSSDATQYGLALFILYLVVLGAITAMRIQKSSDGATGARLYAVTFGIALSPMLGALLASLPITMLMALVLAVVSLFRWRRRPVAGGSVGLTGGGLGWELTVLGLIAVRFVRPQLLFVNNRISLDWLAVGAVLYVCMLALRVRKNKTSVRLAGWLLVHLGSIATYVAAGAGYGPTGRTAHVVALAEAALLLVLVIGAVYTKARMRPVDLGSGAVTVVAVAAVVCAVEWRFLSPDVVLAVLGYGWLLSLVGPQLVRRSIGRMMGDDLAHVRMADQQSTADHVFATTSLRTEGGAFFRGGATQRELELRLPNDKTATVLLGGTRLVSAVQASAGALPWFAPFVTMSTKVSSEPQTSEHDRHRDYAILPLMDGGLGGTLATQVDPEAKQDRFVLDATRPRSNFRAWPLTLLPRLGGPFLQLSTVRVTLGAMVDAERRFLEKLSPEGSRPRVVIARVTGSRRDERPMAGDSLQRELHHLRRRTDGVLHWWPLPGRARDAVLAGYVAAFDAMHPEAHHDEQTACLNDVDELRTLLREKSGERSYPRVEQRSGHVLAVLCTLLTMGMVALSLTPSTATDTHPVGKDIATVHPFFADDDDNAVEMIAVAHEGYQRHEQPSASITLSDFQAASAVGVTYMETDLGHWYPDSSAAEPELIALHKGASATGDAATLEEMLGLPGTRWFFELNDADLIDDLVDKVARIDPEIWKSRICLTFGSIIDQNEVRRIVEAVEQAMGGEGSNPCTCASQIERWRSGDLPLTRRAVQAATRPMYLQPEVDCFVVSDTTIDAGDVASAGKNVMVLSWPTGGEDKEGLTAILETGVHGVMTDNSPMLAELLCPGDLSSKPPCADEGEASPP